MPLLLALSLTEWHDEPPAGLVCMQYTGVDSIVTAELESGREMAKLRRKSLNKRCDALRERILEASVSPAGSPTRAWMEARQHGAY